MKLPGLTRGIYSYIYLSLIVTFISVESSPAQDFGRFKPGIVWQQINTPAVRVIFPEGLESQATRVANNIRLISEKYHSSIGPSVRKIDLILNNQGIISNGYVTVMPFRSEFYTTPMQDGSTLGTLPFLDLLSVHEYRHVLQYINLRRGTTKFGWFLFGDIAWGSIINLTTPGWFFEGDAVAMETALTDQGRGRLPSFLQQYRSLLVSDQQYSYMKARNGSYRDMVPDAYELGYLLCSFGRENFGNDLWSKVVNKTAWVKGIIYPFSDAVLSYTGMNTRQFYKKALLDFQETWKQEVQETVVTPMTPISTEPSTVTEYRFPVHLPSGDILVYKKSYREIGGIYRINANGKEKRVCTTGISQDPYFTSSRNLVTWTEVTWDPRYPSINYSDVIVYDTVTQKKTYLTRKQRYFSPALSPDGTRIVVVDADPDNNYYLKILDSQTGEVISTFQNPKNLYFTYPKWNPDGSSIISSARTSAGKMLIAEQPLSEAVLTELSPEFHQQIGEVFVTEGKILFTSGFTGINNIYSLSRVDGTLRQLTSSRFGACYPAMSPDNKRLVYSEFDPMGYRLVSASTDSLLWKTAIPKRQDQIRQYDFTYFKEEGGNILDRVPDQKFEIFPYRQAAHSIRIHSWALTPGFYATGLNVTSDNILENLHLEAGINYYYTESAPGFTAKVSYGGLYPVLSTEISRYYRHPDIFSVLEGTENSRAISLDNQFSFQAGVPLNFTRGENYRLIDISAGYNFISVKDLTGGFTPSADSYILHAISGSARFQSIRKKALQNISTGLGIGLELSAKRSISNLSAGQYQGIADLSLRGLALNHNLILSAGWKYEPDRNSYQFMNLFIYPRGFSIPQADQMVTLQSAYHLPLLYPDLGFSGIFYCSRVRASIFADFGHAVIPKDFTSHSAGNFASVGSELIFDTRWFNISSIPIGIRFSLLLSPDFAEPERKTRFELVIPVMRL